MNCGIAGVWSVGFPFIESAQSSLRGGARIWQLDCHSAVHAGTQLGFFIFDFGFDSQRSGARVEFASGTFDLADKGGGLDGIDFQLHGLTNGHVGCR